MKTPDKRHRYSIVDTVDATPWFPLFHVPHDGTQFPKELMASVCIRQGAFLAYHEKMRDKYAAQLIPEEYCQGDKVCSFGVSRLLCDVERFIGPEEVMEQYGMGFCYEKAFNGTVIKHVTDELRHKTRKYYDDHHARINQLCRQHPFILFFDMHSYSREIIPADFLHPERSLPDLCIGVDSNFTPSDLANIVHNEFREIGLTVAVNYPYSGCYIPETVMRREAGCHFAGIMLEFNRKAYLDEQDDPIPEKAKRIQEAIRCILKQWRCKAETIKSTR